MEHDKVDCPIEILSSTFVVIASHFHYVSNALLHYFVIRVLGG